MKKKDSIKLAKKNKHIPTEEIEQDIVDTEVEIAQMEREAKHLQATPMGTQDTRWNHIRASGRRSGIEERKRFIKKLEIILEERKSTNPPRG